MDEQQMEQLARQLIGGKLPLADFLAQLARPKTADLGEAQIDLDRGPRCGFPEVIFGEGKTVPMLEKIFRRLMSEGIDVLATRLSAEKAAELLPKFPEANYNPIGKTLRIQIPNPKSQIPNPVAKVVIVTAGTGDLPVAEEARETLAWMGVAATMVHDVGVAGPHRLAERLPVLREADVVIVIAGMEGALPSVVGGHVACPVIGVPTSVGYGVSFGGLSALLSMLNSCAANVTVVNIDAGFKAAYVAGLIAKNQVAARRRSDGG